MIRGLPSLARLALGPSGLWSRSWATSTYYSSSSAPSSPPSGTSLYLLSGRSTRRCKCKIYLTIFNLINYNQQMTTMGCMVDHIHLDKKYIQHTLPKRNNMQFFIIYSFLIVIVYIYMEINEFNFTSINGLILSFLKWFTPTHKVIKGGLLIFPI
jgi:hypothetical protein